MKNFVFPQIFQPVFGQNNTNLLSQWHVTSRRIQTEAELSSEKIKTRKVIKGPHNFLLEPTKLEKCGSNQLKQQSVQNVNQSVQQLKDKDNIQGQKTDMQIWNNSTARNDKENKKINQIRFSTSRKMNNSIRRQNSSRKFQGLKLSNKIEPKNKQIQNLRQSKGGTSLVATKQKNKDTTKIKNKQKKGLKVRFESQQKTEVVKDQQPKVQSQKSIKSQRSQSSYGFKSKKNLPLKQDIRGSSSKKLIHKQKRRFGVENQNAFQVDFEITDTMAKILDNNRRYNQQQDNIISNKQMQIIESECTIYQSKSSISTVEKLVNSKKNKGQGLTCTFIEGGERQVRKHKKSYTIWDVKTESDEEKQATKQKQNNKQSVVKQKSKKKVHFGRTSIQEKTIQKNKVSGLYPSNSKIGKLKGIPKRSSQMEPVQSMVDFGEASSWKVFINNKAEVKKGIKPKRSQINNVYNELNYFRMRLNVSKKQQDDFEVSKPHPQAIIYSVEKVLHELQNDRRERTKYNNMMIDFGVRLTKDYLLKQKPIRQKVINIRA